MKFIKNLLHLKSLPFLQKKGNITSGGLKVICDYTFLDAPNFDILLVPGGKGTRKLITNKSSLSWLKKQKNKTNNVSLYWIIVASSCRIVKKSKSYNTLECPSTFKKSVPLLQ